MVAINSSNSPDFITPEFAKRLDDWMLLKDVYDGLNDCNIRTYLYQNEGEPEKEYEKRAAIAVFENRVTPAIISNSSLLSQYSYQEGTPQEIFDISNNVDGKGTDLESFFRLADIACLTYGATIIFIDPWRPTRLRLIPLNDVTCIRKEEFEGGEILTQIGIRRTKIVPDGEFGTKTDNLIYVYRPGFYQVYREEKGKWIAVDEPVMMTDATGNLLDKIPVVWYSSVPTEIFCPPVPPFLTLAKLNIKHLNKVSELDDVETKCNSPTWVRTWTNAVPNPPPPLKVGKNAAVDIGHGGTINLVEPAGTAISTTHERIKHLEEQMDRTSQAFLTGGEVERTATEARIELGQSKASLRGVSKQKENMSQQVFEWITRFQTSLPVDSYGGIDIDENIFQGDVVPEARLAYDFYVAGIWSRETVIAKLKELGIQPDETEIEGDDTDGMDDTRSNQNSAGPEPE